MSDKSARDAVVRMATDPDFRNAVRGNDPAAFVGLDLTTDEIATLRLLAGDESGAEVEQAAARLSKSGVYFASSLAGLPPETVPEPVETGGFHGLPDETGDGLTVQP